MIRRDVKFMAAEAAEPANERRVGISMLASLADDLFDIRGQVGSTLWRTLTGHGGH